jgi:hypothetical protein
MTQVRDTSGLKRGGISPDAQRRGLETIRRNKEFEDRVAATAKDDPYAAYAEMHETMTRHILKLLKDEAKEGGGLPQKEVTDRLREYRQLTDSLAAYRDARGEAERLKEFFSALDERLAQANFSELSPDAPSDPEGDESPDVDPGETAADLSVGQS